jgi:nicotinamidase-related amidase
LCLITADKKVTLRDGSIGIHTCGTWAAKFHPEFGPLEGDVVVLEHWAQSGFADSYLDSQLKRPGIQKI